MIQFDRVGGERSTHHYQWGKGHIIELMTGCRAESEFGVWNSPNGSVERVVGG